jgi:hypothetical protein
MDRRVGNTKGLGALFGILAAIGINIPAQGSLAWTLAVSLNRFFTWWDSLVSNVFGRKAE